MISNADQLKRELTDVLMEEDEPSVRLSEVIDCIDNDWGDDDEPMDDDPMVQPRSGEWSSSCSSTDSAASSASTVAYPNSSKVTVSVVSAVTDSWMSQPLASPAQMESLAKSVRLSDRRSSTGSTCSSTSDGGVHKSKSKGKIQRC